MSDQSESLESTYESPEIKRSPKTIDIFSTPEMAPSYKVTYFPITALGEGIRFLLSYGGIEFEDIRCEEGDWPKLKPDMPFGQLPILEHDGKIAHQSTAICRYLGKQVDLAGKTDWENLEIDSVVDTVNDLRIKIGTYHYEQDETVKESKKEALFNVTIPFYLERLDKIAKENSGHLAVSRLTWADLFFVSLLHYINFMITGDLIANYPHLVQVKNNVENIPSIKAWIEKRPKTDR